MLRPQRSTTIRLKEDLSNLDKAIELSSGASIPALGLGTWQMQGEDAEYAVRAALEIGYRHIDCARAYGNEAQIGRALAASRARLRRDELWITSKLWNDSHRPEDVRPALERSLADLQLDILDLYLMHWPVAQRAEVSWPESGEDFVSLEELPLAETWGAMQRCVDAGLARHIGVSNFSASRVDALITTSGITPCVNQVEIHPYLQQSALLAHCAAAGIAVTAYSSLGSKGRSANAATDAAPDLFEHEVILAIAERHGASAAQILLAWGMARGLAVIPKSTKRARLEENYAAADIELTAGDLTEIASLERGSRFVDGSFWELPGSPYTVAELWA